MTQIKILLCSVLVALGTVEATAQLKAKAISYAVDVDLTKFAPEAAEELTQKVCRYEVDAYYAEERVRTMVRPISTPYDLTIRQRLYYRNSRDEYNIDHAKQFMLLKKDQSFLITTTGNQRNILGYACKEYTFKDYRGIQFSIWVTDKLPTNICPAGNFSLNGTALEVTSSNGLHYLATDFAEGQLDVNFFDLPKDYQQDISAPPPTSKKSK
jgi:GLPGLI family protein